MSISKFTHVKLVQWSRTSNIVDLMSFSHIAPWSIFLICNLFRVIKIVNSLLFIYCDLGSSSYMCPKFSLLVPNPWNCMCTSQCVLTSIPKRTRWSFFWSNDLSMVFWCIAIDFKGTIKETRPEPTKFSFRMWGLNRWLIH